MKKESTRLTATSELIGKYINRRLWTDVVPEGMVVGIKGKTTLILAHVHVERNEDIKMNFIPGGFSAHCTNNYAQEWIFTVDKSNLREFKFTKGNMHRCSIEDSPRYFYDFNF